jgi:hypothetical protein
MSIITRVAPDPIFSIPPDPDRISEVESGRSRIPGVVDNGTLIITLRTTLHYVTLGCELGLNRKRHGLLHCFVLELDTAFCSLMYGQVLYEKLSKNFSVSGGNPTADPAGWEPDPNPEKAPDFRIRCNPNNNKHLFQSKLAFQ